MSQRTNYSRVSTTTRGSGATKRSRTSYSTNATKAMKKTRRAKNKSMVAFAKNQPFPFQLVTTLRYHEYVSIALNASGYGWATFSCNNLYDPNIGGTGHQPMYFDQLMQIYNHYTCLRSKITVTPVGGVNSYTPDVVNGTLTLVIDDDTSPSLASVDDAPERPGAVSKTFNTGTGPIPSLVKYWNSGITFPGDALSRDELQGTASTGPSEQSYYIIFLNMGTGIASTTRTVRVEVEYTAVFDEWKSIGSS